MSFEDNSWISQNDLLRTDYAMIALTCTVFIARTVVQILRRKTIEFQDGWLYVAFAAFISFSTCFIIITPTFFKIETYQKDPTNPASMWAGMAKDIKFASQIMWSSGFMFWTCLWCVKASLLALYKKLLVGLSSAWIWTYWIIVAFCALTYISCIITGPVIACNSTRKFLYHGEMCYAPDELRRQTANMYYAFSVDVLTNLLVMFLPLRLVMPLRMPRRQKIGVGILFTSGLVCIVFSTIRIVQITSRDGKPKSPDPKWLTMWTIIESSTAIIIGCCPTLAVLIPKAKSTDRSPPNDQGYVRQSGSGGSRRPAMSRFRLQGTNSSGGRKNNTNSETSWVDTQDGQENSNIDDERRRDPRNLRQLRKMVQK